MVAGWGWAQRLSFGLCLLPPSCFFSDHTPWTPSLLRPQFPWYACDFTVKSSCPNTSVQGLLDFSTRALNSGDPKQNALLRRPAFLSDFSIFIKGHPPSVMSLRRSRLNLSTGLISPRVGLELVTAAAPTPTHAVLSGHPGAFWRLRE